uniref:NADH:ubiquinone oxidoreductase intermediate-associated protein 30 domain-containing protein n=1 Tax=Craspedostauros australis TaxID=1486917 RepID=A0A7R9ZKS6_9STRA|mmetsp:Transcript_14197/g.39112  ORF Transcript_14197/g.39112 Transcript_14197/m.39112 type:complete len:206 (+) Transcript_14197:183-800(+)
MKLCVSSAIAATLVGMFSTANADILLQDFTMGPSGWEVKTDDVIPGGSSQGGLFPAGDRTYFDGIVTYQPFIGGPGFVKIVSTKSFPDISSCAAIEVTLNSVIGYDGYYIAFGDTPPTDNMPIPFEWRAHVHVDAPGDNKYVIPFSEFSNYWDFATGKVIIPCSDDPSVCAPPSVLSNIQFLEIWAQGVEGQFVTDLFSIKAVGC